MNNAQLSVHQMREELSNIVGSASLNVGLMRPFMEKGKDGVLRAYATINVNGQERTIRHPLTTHGTLRRDEWKRLDDAVIRIAEKELVGINDLRAAGLTYPLSNALGTTQFEWHQVSDAGEAAIDMDAEVRTEGDRVKFRYNYTPIPIVYMDYSLSKRTLEASRKFGDPLDTTMAERAARKVGEKLEDMLFTNTTFSFGTNDERGRNSIYSYINFPDRNAVTLSTYGNWDDVQTGTTNNEPIVNSVLAMIQAAWDQHFRGPYVLYVPGNYRTTLDADYEKTNSSNQTIRQRLEAIDGISKVQVVKSLPDDNVLLVQMSSDVVRLIDGLPIQNIEWMVNGGFIGKFKVLTIQVPQLRSDYDGRCGIVHMS